MKRILTVAVLLMSVSFLLSGCMTQNQLDEILGEKEPEIIIEKKEEPAIKEEPEVKEEAPEIKEEPEVIVKEEPPEIKEEPKVEETPEPVVEKEEELTAKDFKLELGENAKISPNDIQSLYGEDVEMLQRFNDFSGKKAPDFQMTNLDGETLTLSDYLGQNIILEFMGTWCPSCKKTIGNNESFNGSYEGATIIGLGINENNESLSQYVLDNNIEATEYMLVDEEVEDAYDIFFVPLYVFIDKEGYLQMMLVGNVPESMLVAYADKSFN